MSRHAEICVKFQRGLQTGFSIWQYLEKFRMINVARATDGSCLKCFLYYVIILKQSNSRIHLAAVFHNWWMNDFGLLQVGKHQKRKKL